MISLKSNKQIELLFSPLLLDGIWTKLSKDTRAEILEQLSLFLLTYLDTDNAHNKSQKEDQLCQEK